MSLLDHLSISSSSSSPYDSIIPFKPKQKTRNHCRFFHIIPLQEQDAINSPIQSVIMEMTDHTILFEGLLDEKIDRRNLYIEKHHFMQRMACELNELKSRVNVYAEEVFDLVSTSLERMKADLQSAAISFFTTEAKDFFEHQEFIYRMHQLGMIKILEKEFLQVCSIDGISPTDPEAHPMLEALAESSLTSDWLLSVCIVERYTRLNLSRHQRTTWSILQPRIQYKLDETLEREQIVQEERMDHIRIHNADESASLVQLEECGRPILISEELGERIRAECQWTLLLEKTERFQIQLRARDEFQIRTAKWDVIKITLGPIQREFELELYWERSRLGEAIHTPCQPKRKSQLINRNSPIRQQVEPPVRSSVPAKQRQQRVAVPTYRVNIDQSKRAVLAREVEQNPTERSVWYKLAQDLMQDGGIAMVNDQRVTLRYCMRRANGLE